MYQQICLKRTINRKKLALFNTERTSGAIHCTVPQFPVILRSCALRRLKPKSATFAL